MKEGSQITPKHKEQISRVKDGDRHADAIEHEETDVVGLKVSQSGKPETWTTIGALPLVAMR